MEFLGYRVGQAADLLMALMAVGDLAVTIINFRAAIMQAAQAVARQAATTIVDVGTTDLSSARQTVRQGVRMTIVDPIPVPQDAVTSLRQEAVEVLKGTSKSVPAQSADVIVCPVATEVLQSQGAQQAQEWAQSTAEAIAEAIRITKADGTVSVVTESEQTAQDVAKNLSQLPSPQLQVDAVSTVPTEAASGGSGPGTSKGKVYVVNAKKTPPPPPTPPGGGGGFYKPPPRMPEVRINAGGEGELAGWVDLNPCDGSNRLSADQIRAKNPTGDLVIGGIEDIATIFAPNSAPEVRANRLPSLVIGRHAEEIAKGVKAVLKPGGKASITCSSPLGPDVIQIFQSAGWKTGTNGATFVKP
jgi:hypothetical protein